MTDVWGSFLVRLLVSTLTGLSGGWASLNQDNAVQHLSVVYGVGNSNTSGRGVHLIISGFSHKEEAYKKLRSRDLDEF